MKPAQPLKEFIIILSVFAAICLFVWLSVMHLFGKWVQDINMSDTYTIVKSLWIVSVLPPFLWLLTIIYLIRSRINQFKNRLQNIIFLVSCGCLNVLMLSYFELASKSENNTFQGATIYPPLSQLNDHIARSPSTPFTNTVQILFTIQIILLLLLVIIAFITGKNWKTNNAHEIL